MAKDTPEKQKHRTYINRNGHLVPKKSKMQEGPPKPPVECGFGPKQAGYGCFMKECRCI